MDKLLNFLADNYVYFMIGAVILLFALIGFFVDGKRKKKKAMEAETQNVGMQSVASQPTNEVPTNVNVEPNAFVNTPVQPQEEKLVIEEPSLNRTTNLEEEINQINNQEPSLNFATPTNESVPVQAPSEPVIDVAPASNPESIFDAPAVVPAPSPVQEPIMAPAPEAVVAPTPIEQPLQTPAPAPVQTPENLNNNNTQM